MSAAKSPTRRLTVEALEDRVMPRFHIGNVVHQVVSHVQQAVRQAPALVQHVAHEAARDAGRAVKEVKHEAAQVRSEVQRGLSHLGSTLKQVEARIVEEAERGLPHLALALVVTPGAKPPAADRNLTAFGRADWQLSGTAPVQRVIRSSAELKALGVSETDLAGRLGVGSIDWGKQMLVVASDGVKPSAGYHVNVNSVVARPGRLTVNYQVTAPRPGTLTAQVLTHPAQFALTERFDGRAEFRS